MDPTSLNMYAGLSVGSSGLSCFPNVDIGSSILATGEPHAIRSAQKRG